MMQHFKGARPDIRPGPPLRQDEPEFMRRVQAETQRKTAQLNRWIAAQRPTAQQNGGAR